MIQGTIIRVAGPVVDVQFTAGRLPALQEALTVTAEGTERTMEVTQHVNETTVRCIMLSASEGLGKGMEVTATGHGLNAPVGEGTLGRMFDPLGRPIDGKGSVDEVPHWPIHRKAPSFAEQKPATEILETGIKVIDLLAPYAKGGKIGLFGGAGFAGLFAVLACILTGAGQLVVIVGKALFGLVFVGFGFAGHIVHDGFAFADDFADGANQKEVQHVQCNEEVHQLENQGDIKVQHYRILPLDGVMFKAFIKYPQQGVMSKGIGDKIRKVFASVQTIL